MKHVPTGLYYQPHRHRGSNLSKRGKVYQTSINGLSSSLRNSLLYPEIEAEQIFYVYAERDSSIHREFSNSFKWEDSCAYSQVKAPTKLTDWTAENII